MRRKFNHNQKQQIQRPLFNLNISLILVRNRHYAKLKITFIFLILDDNKSVDEVTSQLFASLNLTAANFGGQLHNIEAYRSALDKVVRAAIVSANQSLAANNTATQNQEQEVEIPVIIEQEPLTTTTDTREYTEKRSEPEEKN